MQFKFRETPKIPKLAWCAKIVKGNPSVEIFHGTDVEIRPHAFSEGAWDGDFEHFQFIDSIVRCGTGGRIDDDHIHFAGSTDRSSPLTSIRKRDTLHVSNSLLLLLNASGEKPDPIYPYYAYDIVKIWRSGLGNLNGSLPLESGNEIRLHFGAQMRVNKKGEFTMHLSAPGVKPTNYNDYRTNLENSVGRVLSNAQSAARKKQYSPLAAISKGYDSTATAILARDGGCKETVSLLDSKEDDPYLDSGRANSEQLGMQPHEVDRWKFDDLPASNIAELSLFGISTLAPLAGFEKLLEKRIFITGNFGDTILDPKRAACADGNSQSWARFASGLGALEFRLRVGYIGFSPLFIMSRHNGAIHELTHSPEMRAWHVDGSYNRPIARRIIEEAGISSSRFAQINRGGGHAQLQPKSKKHKSAVAVQAYLEYVTKSHSNVSNLRLNYWKQRVKFDYFIWTKLGPEQKSIVKASYWQTHFPFIANCPPTEIKWEYMFSFQWAHHTLKHRYEMNYEANPSLNSLS